MLMQHPSPRLIFLMLAFVAPIVAGCVHDDVPLPLNQIGSTAHDAYDDALEAKQTRVEDEAETIERAWAGYRTHAAHDGAAGDTVSALDAAVSKLRASAKATSDPVELAHAANAVTRLAAVLYGLYHPATPAVLYELQYLGREIALDGRAGDFKGASESTTKLDATWKEVRAKLKAAGAAFTAQKYEETLSGIHEAIASADTASLVFHAKRGLDATGVMETVLSD
jgi:hypothetical protein